MSFRRFVRRSIAKVNQCCFLGIFDVSKKRVTLLSLESTFLPEDKILRVSNLFSVLSTIDVFIDFTGFRGTEDVFKFLDLSFSHSKRTNHFIPLPQRVSPNPDSVAKDASVVSKDQTGTSDVLEETTDTAPFVESTGLLALEECVREMVKRLKLTTDGDSRFLWLKDGMMVPVVWEELETKVLEQVPQTVGLQADMARNHCKQQLLSLRMWPDTFLDSHKTARFWCWRLVDERSQKEFDLFSDGTVTDCCHMFAQEHLKVFRVNFDPSEIFPVLSDCGVFHDLVNSHFPNRQRLPFLKLLKTFVTETQECRGKLVTCFCGPDRFGEKGVFVDFLFDVFDDGMTARMSAGSAFPSSEIREETELLEIRDTSVSQLFTAPFGRSLESDFGACQRVPRKIVATSEEVLDKRTLFSRPSKMPTEPTKDDVSVISVPFNGTTEIDTTCRSSQHRTSDNLLFLLFLLKNVV